MAVLGAQLVITLVMVSVIQKLSPHYSFAKWILCRTGLHRYLHPTDDELRSRGGVPKEKPPKGGRNKHANGSGSGAGASARAHSFTYRAASSVYTGIVYVVSELFHFFYPLRQEINLSMVWCLLVIFFALKLLSSLTVLYFQIYLLVAMVVLIVDERILETGLEDAYASFNASASKFLTEQGLPSSGPASKIVVKFFLAMGCGLLGSLFTFPGLRMAKMHWDSLKYCRGNRLLQVLLNLSFVLPFILVILWIRPISRDYLTVRVFQGMQQPLLKPHVFETLRLLLVILVVVVRFALMPIYLQSYLNLAHDKILDLRKEAGRITNVEFKQKISSIFYYLCVVTLQFAAPLILCLYLTLMYKSLGGFSWSGIFQDSVVLQHECAASEVEPIGGSSAVSQGDGEFNILESAQSLQASFSSLKNVFSTEVYKGFLGFATWWSYFTLFATSSLGIVYQSYFNKT
ncbi:hypothetical protein M5D96_006227 [Drosophila gunungcola]|uniref:Transmembrane protein 161B n=1 Tax=Drosophila gunungcola TaxID=103775 RepID=A0A9P9YNR4_9MUSC|nr:hypothetical protein M5D96_006227 [Drosophila gunungcola]